MRMIILLAALTASACAPDDPDTAQDVDAINAAFVTAVEDAGGEGVVVFAETPRAPPGGYLSADRSNRDAERVHGAQVLRIASNTKTFVAVAALKLVEDGRLSLDAPIRDGLPGP